MRVESEEVETKVNGLDVDVFIDQILQLLVPRVIEGLALLTGEELTEEQRRIFGQQFEEMLRAALVGELGSDGLTIEGLYFGGRRCSDDHRRGRSFGMEAGIGAERGGVRHLGTG